VFLFKNKVSTLVVTFVEIITLYGYLKLKFGLGLELDVVKPPFASQIITKWLLIF